MAELNTHNTVGIKNLAIAVITQAVLDLKSKKASLLEKGSAKHFLFNQTKEWAEHRGFFCEASGIDESWLRKKLKEKGYEEI